VVVNRTHSIVKLKRAIDEVASRGAKVIDRRTHIGRELMRWRGEVEQDLGGPESLSAQQHTVLDIAMRTKLVLDSTDYWLVKQASLVDKRHKQLFPIVQQRAALADSLLRQLSALGLGRKAKHVQSLSDYLAAHREPSETARSEPEKTP
jgi:hypothetical protein